MRSTCRSFIVAVLVTVAAGASYSLGQEANPAPPPQAPPAVQPAGELPQIPVVKSEAAPAASATDPDVQSAPLASPAVVKPASTSKTVTTTGKHAAMKSRSKPVEKPAVDVTAAAQIAGPTASMAAVEAPVNPPPADAASIAASKPPALKPAGDPVSPEAKSDRTMGLGGWVLFGIGIVALFSGITLVRRRRATVRHRSITDFSPTTAELKLQPALARRP